MFFLFKCIFHIKDYMKHVYSVKNFNQDNACSPITQLK